MSEVRGAFQGRLKESSGKESPGSGWLLKNQDFFFPWRSDFEEHGQHPNPYGIRHGNINTCRDVPAEAVREERSWFPSKGLRGRKTLCGVTQLPDGLNGNKL